MDYTDISAAVNPMIEALDHRHLGSFDAAGNSHALSTWKPEGPGVNYPDDINPTSENLLYWIGGHLRKSISWSKLALEETCNVSCEMTWTDFYRLQQKEIND